MEVPAIKRGLKPENACTEVWQIFASKVFRVIMDSSMKDYGIEKLRERKKIITVAQIIMQDVGKKIIAEPLETPTISTLPEIKWPESLSTEDSLFLFNICCSESFIEKAKEVYRRNQPKIIVTEDGLSTLKYLIGFGEGHGEKPPRKCAHYLLLEMCTRLPIEVLEKIPDTKMFEIQGSGGEIARKFFARKYNLIFTNRGLGEHARGKIQGGWGLTGKGELLGFTPDRTEKFTYQRYDGSPTEKEEDHRNLKDHLWKNYGFQEDEWERAKSMMK